MRWDAAILALLNKEFEYYYAMLNPAGTFEILYRPPGSETVQSRTLPAAGRGATRPWRAEKVPGEVLNPEAPLYFSRDEDSGAAVLRLPTFGIPSLNACYQLIKGEE